MQATVQGSARAYPVKPAVAAVFAIPLLYIAMAPVTNSPLPAALIPAICPAAYAATQVVLTIPILLAGNRLYISGFGAILKRRPNLDSLAAMGTAAAIIYSLYSTGRIAAGDYNAAENLYFSTVGVIVTLILIGEYFERLLKSRILTAKTQADAETAPTDAVHTRFSRFVGGYAPLVFVIAALSAIAWMVAGQSAGFALTVFISVLVTAYPCALGLAEPAAVMAAGAGGGEAVALTRNINRNRFLAFVYNVLGIPAAAGAFYALGGPMPEPMLAAAAMGLGMASVAVNALRTNAAHRQQRLPGEIEHPHKRVCRAGEEIIERDTDVAAGEQAHTPDDE